MRTIGRSPRRAERDAYYGDLVLGVTATGVRVITDVHGPHAQTAVEAQALASSRPCRAFVTTGTDDEPAHERMRCERVGCGHDYAAHRRAAIG